MNTVNIIRKTKNVDMRAVRILAKDGAGKITAYKRI